MRVYDAMNLYGLRMIKIEDKLSERFLERADANFLKVSCTTEQVWVRMSKDVPFYRVARDNMWSERMRYGRDTKDEIDVNK